MTRIFKAIVRRGGGRAVAGCATVLLLASCGGGAPHAAPSPAASPTQTARAAADGRIALLQQRAHNDSLDYPDLDALAIEFLQRARETGDVADLTRAGDALARSLQIRPQDNLDAVALSATLSVTRHDFARGAELARQTIALNLREAYGYGALGDALMGLGQYGAAADAYAQDLQLEPGLSSYGRMALLATNTGRRGDALMMWQRTIAATQGDPVPEHAGWAHAQLANFYFLTGDLARAREQYEASLDVFPGYVHAYAGLARVAAAQGDTAGAIAEYRKAIDAVPLPEYVIALGDVYASVGNEKDASAQHDLVRAIEQLYEANAVSLDIQIGIFNADHNRDLPATLARAKKAYAAQPSVQASDMLAWVQYRSGDVAGARVTMARVLEIGTFDPLVLYHAGMIAMASGDTTAAEDLLARVEAQAPHFSVVYGAPAADALRALQAQARR